MVPLSKPSACILVVDSNTTLVNKFSAALQVRFEQISIIACSSARDALRQLQAIDVDAVFGNIHLPDMTALKFLAAIQEQQSHLPVLLFTTNAHYRLVQDVVAVGAYDIIRDPIDWDHLEMSLSSAIHARKVEQLRQQLLQQNQSLSMEDLLQGLKVLVVDDDTHSKNFQTIALETCGAEVSAATSVEAALELLRQFEPDILVSDIRMPLQDGYSLVRQLRRSATCSIRSIPAIAVTAYANEEERGQSLKAGFQFQVPKPIDPDILVLMVASLTGRLRPFLVEA